MPISQMRLACFVICVRLRNCGHSILPRPASAQRCLCRTRTRLSTTTAQGTPRGIRTSTAPSILRVLGDFVVNSPSSSRKRTGVALSPHNFRARVFFVFLVLSARKIRSWYIASLSPRYSHGSSPRWVLNNSWLVRARRIRQATAGDADDLLTVRWSSFVPSISKSEDWEH